MEAFKTYLSNLPLTHICLQILAVTIAIMFLFSLVITVIEERRTIWRAVWMVEDQSDIHIPLHTYQSSGPAVKTSPPAADDTITLSPTPFMSNSLKVREMSRSGASIIHRQTM
jgi:hypothetical protein